MMKASPPWPYAALIAAAACVLFRMESPRGSFFAAAFHPNRSIWQQKLGVVPHHADRPVPTATCSAAGDSDSNDGSAECTIDSLLWSTAGESAAKCLPSEPDPTLTAEEVIVAVVRGLQHNDVPKPDSGLARCYNFMDLPCKKLVTGYGNVPEERTLDAFVRHATVSPKVRPFVGAVSLELGKVNRIEGTKTRGEIASMVIKVRASAARDKDAKEKKEEVEGMTGKGPEQTFMIRLQKQRRPPLAGAYLVTDLVDVATVASISRPLNRE